MGLKITIENESSVEEDCAPCAKCGAEVETDDKYCCQCGSKVASGATSAKARLSAMNKMAPPTVEAEGN